MGPKSLERHIRLRLGNEGHQTALGGQKEWIQTEELAGDPHGLGDRNRLFLELDLKMGCCRDFVDDSAQPSTRRLA